MTKRARLVLASISSGHLDALVRALQDDAPRRGRPWALSLSRRIMIGVTSLRTNVTVRELAALFAISRSQAHRVVADIVARRGRRRTFEERPIFVRGARHRPIQGLARAT
jgi:hypothetical protein